ncbi:hypothetical protein L2E82_35734 [Cichorium intybus]|uniref:Uncharacterized protein n=1 Tax=Cichorium intybus TaxID=13427 RepID=A0ACB9BPR9_CICIN|nr:hypothetical protein L2E82_35734 [Cichorium intybus]
MVLHRSIRSGTSNDPKFHNIENYRELDSSRSSSCKWTVYVESSMVIHRSAYFPRNPATGKYPLTRNFKLNDVVRESSDFLRICDFLHVLQTILGHGLIRRELFP